MRTQQTKTEIETFVKAWVAAHVRAMPGRANLAYEVDRLAADLTGDARASFCDPHPSQLGVRSGARSA